MHPPIGPHDERELELMKAGSKPLSMFTEPIPSNMQHFPEEEFDKMVANGELIKHVSIEVFKADGIADVHTRRILYVLPAEEWRIKAILLVHEIYSSIGGWRLDLDRIIGALLGYNPNDIEEFVNRKKH